MDLHRLRQLSKGFEGFRRVSKSSDGLGWVKLDLSRVKLTLKRVQKSLAG